MENLLLKKVTMRPMVTVMHHRNLFLITENEDGILLSSYEIPEGEDKNTFSYDSMKNVDYSD